MQKQWFRPFLIATGAVMFLATANRSRPAFAQSAATVQPQITAAAPSAPNTITLVTLFGDNMVLQRNVSVPIWGHAAPGETVFVSLNKKQAAAKAGADGAWQAILPPQPAGGPYTLTVSGSQTTPLLTRTGVLLGDVWLCSGQSNMELALRRAKNGAEAIASADDPGLRLFKVGQASPTIPARDVKATWKASNGESAATFSAVAYFFGRALRRTDAAVPIGLVETSVGGTPAQAWTREAALVADPDLKKRYLDTYPAEQAAHDQAMQKYSAALADAAPGKKAPQKPYSFWRPGSLYNGLIAPLTRFPLRGVLWYQGETNAKDPVGYRTLLPTLIQDWRAQWHDPALPFLLVQLPPFGSPAGNGMAWAEMREIQAQTAQKLPNVWFVVTTDVGLQHDIHPTDKEPVGERLALAARRTIYKQASVAAFGPTFRNVKINKNKAIVTFDNAGDGLIAHGGMASGQPVSEKELVGFMIAGADGKFVPAYVEIVGKNTVAVSSPDVPSPVAVRFGFENFPVLNLWNKNGLPAAPFRTDAPPLL